MSGSRTPSTRALEAALAVVLAENPTLPSLSADQREALVTHGELLARWNRVHNLTRVERPEEVARRHFADALSGLAALEAHAAGIREGAMGQTVADVGSGAGFPGVMAALLWPTREVVLIEAARKRASFLQQVARELGLGNLLIENAREEDIAPARFALVLTRATLPWEELPRLGRLLAPSGWLAAWVSEQPSAAAWSARLTDLAALPDALPHALSERTLADAARVPYAVSGLPERALLMARAEGSARGNE